TKHHLGNSKHTVFSNVSQVPDKLQRRCAIKLFLNFIFCPHSRRMFYNQKPKKITKKSNTNLKKADAGKQVEKVWRREAKRSERRESPSYSILAWFFPLEKPLSINHKFRAQTYKHPTHHGLESTSKKAGRKRERRENRKKRKINLPVHAEQKETSTGHPQR